MNPGRISIVDHSDIVKISLIDEERFGIRTAKASSVTIDNLPTILNFCQTNKVELLISRCSASELSLAQEMEQTGFLLMDTLVYFSRNLDITPIPVDIAEVTVRPMQPGEQENIRSVASESFRGYFGHYHADRRLDPAKCDEVYTDWAYRSCVSKDVADEVLVAELGGKIVGFATMRLNRADEGEGVLFGVAPEAQGKGIYRSFMIHGMEWCILKGANCMIVSTQITNIAVQKVWVRVGFEPNNSYYTFHKWFY